MEIRACTNNFTVRVENAEYIRAAVIRDASRIELNLDNAVSPPCTASIQLINAVHGNYEVVPLGSLRQHERECD